MFVSCFAFSCFDRTSALSPLVDPQRSGMSSGTPRQLASPEETFQALATQFNFSSRIKDKIVELGLRTLSEFRFYFQNEDEEVKRFFVDSLNPSLTEGESRLQTARVRFAWTACQSLRTRSRRLPPNRRLLMKKNSSFQRLSLIEGSLLQAVTLEAASIEILQRPFDF